MPENYDNNDAGESNGNPLRRRSVEGLRTVMSELMNDDLSPKRDYRKVKGNDSGNDKCSCSPPQCGRNKIGGADGKTKHYRKTDANEAEPAELLQTRQLTNASTCCAHSRETLKAA